MKEFLKRQLTMSRERSFFYIKWGNFGILTVNMVMGLVARDSGWFFGYLLATMWCWMYFQIWDSLREQRDEAMNGWQSSIELLEEINKRYNANLTKTK